MRLVVLALLACVMTVGVARAATTVVPPATVLYEAESPIGSDDPFNFDGGDDDELDELSRLAVYILVVIVVGLVGWMLSS